MNSPMAAALAGVLALSAAPAAVARQGLDFDVYRETVEPIFIRSRGDFRPPDPGNPACVMCHTWQTNTRLALETLEEDADGGVFWTEDQSRRNFEAVSRLVAPGDPDNSRLLRKPLAAPAGGTPSHTGGKFWTSRDDPEWQAIAAWVRAASGPAPAEGEVDYAFFRACVQPIFINAVPGSLPCTECHTEGGSAFLQGIPDGRGVWTEEESRRNFEIVTRLIAPGFPAQSRLLMHPLHPDGGGDYAHNGVRRWMSRDDPEWQMLAAWVRGERAGADCRR